MNRFTPVIGGAFAAIAALTALPALASPAYATRDLTVRSGPGVTYDSVGRLVKDEPVDKGNCNPDGTWCYVRHDGENGWVTAVFLSATPPGQSQPTPPAQQPVSGADYRATITVNVRTGPDTSFAAVDRLEAGEQVKRGQCTSDGTWCYVTHDGSDGWVAARYLTPLAPPQQNPNPPSQGPSGNATRIATADVNVRTGPDTSYTAVDRLDRNERVELVQCSPDGSWCYVTHDGPDGWVSADYLRTPNRPGNQNPGNQTPGTPPAQTQKIGTAISGMPVRGAPTLFTSTVGHLEKGQTIPVESCSTDGYWCHVVSSSIDGWVPAAFLRITETQPSPPSASNIATAARATPIRRMPGGQSAIVGMLQAGTTVTVNQCGPQGNYCQITRNGMTGWVEADVLQAAPNTPPAPPSGQQPPNSVCFTGFGGIEICLSN